MSPGGGLDISAELAARCVAWERAGRTVVLAGWDGQARGAIAVADTVKPSAAGAVRALRALGLRTILLTGDNQATADAVAAEAGIGEVIAEAMPDGKVAVIADLQAQGRLVAMVGDGVNDKAGPGRSRLRPCHGLGRDVAICATDVILLHDDLNRPRGDQLDRAALATIRRNLASAFGTTLPRSAGHRRVPRPADRRGGDGRVVVFVVANSVRLRHSASRRRRRAMAAATTSSPRGLRERHQDRPGDGSGTKEHTASCLE